MWYLDVIMMIDGNPKMEDEPWLILSIPLVQRERILIGHFTSG